MPFCQCIARVVRQRCIPHQSAHQQCRQPPCTQSLDGSDGKFDAGKRPPRDLPQGTQGNRQASSEFQGGTPPFVPNVGTIPCRRAPHQGRRRQAGQAAFPRLSPGRIQTAIPGIGRRSGPSTPKHESRHRRWFPESGRRADVCRTPRMDRSTVCG